MKKMTEKTVSVLLVLLLLAAFPLTASAAFHYKHNPMDNPSAAADIIEDPQAVYGFAPNPDSKRLGEYASYDWSDKDFVAKMRKQREEYHESMQELYDIKAQMEKEGKSIEDIARAVSTRRNELRIEAYKNDPEGLEKLKKSNLETYGNENGGTPEYFYQKYGSWATVLEKAFASNAGADACLGLYDEYYYTYVIDNGSADAPDTGVPAPGGLLLTLALIGTGCLSATAVKTAKKRKQ